MREDKQILLVTQKDAGLDDPSVKDLYEIGTVATVLQLLKLPDGTVKVLVEGGKRAEISGFVDNPEFFQAYAAVREEADEDDSELEALARSVVTQFEQYIKLNKKIPPEVLVSVNQIEEPAKLADTVASHLSLKISEKQELLKPPLSGIVWNAFSVSWNRKSASCRSRKNPQPRQAPDGKNPTRVLSERAA